MPSSTYHIFVKDASAIRPLIERLCIDYVNVKMHYSLLYHYDYMSQTFYKDRFMGYFLEFPGTYHIDRIKKFAADMPWITIKDKPNADWSEIRDYVTSYSVSEKIPVGVDYAPISKTALVKSLPYLYCYQLKFLGQIYGIKGAEKMRRIKLLNALKRCLA
jgi:hypothetical protein